MADPWITKEPVTQETCTCGAHVVVQRDTPPLSAERILREFRDAHRQCREARSQSRAAKSA